MPRTRKVEFDTTVLGGFPVTVRARIYPAEPDIGIMGAQAEVQDILTLRHQDGYFIAKRMKDEDWEKLAQEAVEHASQG